jgi:hypothetical protein
MKFIRFPAVAASVIGSLVILPFLASPARADNACTSAFETILKLHSYRSTMTTDRGVTTVDVVIPDRAHLIGKGTEMIVIGNHAWMRSNGDVWRAQPAGAIDYTAMFAKARQRLEDRKNDRSCVVSGVGTFHGRPAQVLTFSHKGPNGTTSGRAYVLADGYIHRVETNGTPPTSMEFSDFNSVSINPP